MTDTATELTTAEQKKADKAAKKKVEESRFTIPLRHYLPPSHAAVADAVADTDMDVVVSPTDADHARAGVVTIHGPNHVGHPKHTLSWTTHHTFNAVSGNPVFVFDNLPELAEAPANKADQEKFDAALPALVKRLMSNYNEETAPGAFTAAKKVQVQQGGTQERHRLMSDAFAPMDVVHYEVQDFTDANDKDRFRLCVEVKPRVPISRAAFDVAQERMRGTSKKHEE